MPMSVGDVIGDRYKIIKLLKKGGFGIVYMAEDDQINRLVAIKRIYTFDELKAIGIEKERGKKKSPHGTVEIEKEIDEDGYDEMKKLFRREVEMMGGLDHPNVATIFDIGTDDADGADYIVMEYFGGGDLEGLLNRVKFLDPCQALKIMADVLSGLCAAHEKHIVHGDIKPSNILFDVGGVAKLTDFGISHIAAFLHNAPYYAKDSTRRELGVLGCPPYMSPEQVRGEKLNCITDIYSSGAVLYAMLAGQYPYEDKFNEYVESLQQTVQTDSNAWAKKIFEFILSEKPTPLESLQKEVPPFVEKLMERMMQKEIDKRCPDAKTALNEVRHCIPMVKEEGGDPARNLIFGRSFQMLNSPTSILADILGMLLADGKITKKERKELKRRAQILGVGKVMLDHIEEKVRYPLRDIPEPRTPKTPCIKGSSKSRTNVQRITPFKMTADLLNRFKIEKVLHCTQTSIVYLAEDILIGRPVVIKQILKLKLGEDRICVDRFVKGARLAGMLEHPNIVTIYDIWSDPTSEYIISEYIGGGNLEQLIARQKRLEICEALEITAATLSALDATHNILIVHGGIKPSNIVFGLGAVPKINDFGLAWLYLSRKVEILPRTIPESWALNFYMSPEQAAGEVFDWRTDIYSAGAVLYKMLSGTTPLSLYTSEKNILDRILNGSPASLLYFRDDVPKFVEDIMRKMMAKNPAKRYQSAHEALEDVLNARKEIKHGSSAKASFFLSLSNDIATSPVAIVKDIIRLCFADLKITKAEYKPLILRAQKLGISKAKLKIIIRLVRAEMMEEKIWADCPDNTVTPARWSGFTKYASKIGMSYKEFYSIFMKVWMEMRKR